MSPSAADPRSVLVTGGAGYVGSHTCKALHAAGYRPVVFDNLSAGHREAVQYGELVEGDVADVGAVRRVLKHYDVSAVLHFAGLLDVGESVREPGRYYRANVIGTLGLLEAMVAESVSRFVYSSTCATYGEPIAMSVAETHPQRPASSYGETKLAIERALPHFERASGLRWIALRYFNAAGADPDGEIGEDHSPEIHAIPRAIDAATGGARFEVFGDDYPTPDGTCQRDYVHVSDLADAHVKALDALANGGASQAYNLGTGRPHSVRQVVAAVERVTGQPLVCPVGPRRPGDPPALWAAPDKARAELGWTPRFVDLDEIVRTAWLWHQTHPLGYQTAAKR